MKDHNSLASNLRPNVQNLALQVCSGSNRFNRLMKSARHGEESAPADMRFLRKGIPTKGCQNHGDSRARIVTFLRGIYDSVAETLPDARDDAYDFGAIQIAELPELGDAYAEKLMEKPEPQRKARKRKFSLTINQDHKDEVRYLPPGHMKDYWLQLVAAEKCPAGSSSGSWKQIPFSSFWRVWYEEFSFMKFRASSSHSQCGQCLRHKLLLREMSGYIHAREEQARLFSLHLKKQYADRMVYWSCRSSARSQSPTEACLILDGMDQAKFCYPRADEFKSKELQSLARPRAHISGLIMHGRFVLFVISPANLPKDSNLCIEITAHALQLLSKEVDLSRVVLSVQADNTTREVKNNHYIRFLTALVSHGNLD